MSYLVSLGLSWPPLELPLLWDLVWSTGDGVHSGLHTRALRSIWGCLTGVPPYWEFNLQPLRMWQPKEIGALKKWFWLGPVWWEYLVDVQGKAECLQGNERSSQRKKPCWHHALELQPLEYVSVKIYSQVCDSLCAGQSKLLQRLSHHMPQTKDSLCSLGRWKNTCFNSSSMDTILWPGLMSDQNVTSSHVLGCYGPHPLSPDLEPWYRVTFTDDFLPVIKFTAFGLGSLLCHFTDLSQYLG